MPDRSLVLLPPSQGKAEGGRRRFRARSGAFAGLSAARMEVIEAIATAVRDDPDVAAKLFGAKGALLDRAVLAIERLADGSAPVLPASSRYTGVVWDHLDPATLDRDALDRVAVPSALVGLVTGVDPVPDYRLTFNASVPGLGRLDRFWRTELTKSLAEWADGGTVVEMLPIEHQRALDLDEIATLCRLVRVRFVSSDGSKAVGHAAKAVKGIAARSVLTEGVAGLAGLHWEGWRAQQTAENLVELVAP